MTKYEDLPGCDEHDENFEKCPSCKEWICTNDFLNQCDNCAEITHRDCAIDIWGGPWLCRPCCIDLYPTHATVLLIEELKTTDNLLTFVADIVATSVKHWKVIPNGWLTQRTAK